jgi:hypothetical protein
MIHRKLNEGWSDSVYCIRASFIKMMKRRNEILLSVQTEDIQYSTVQYRRKGWNKIVVC